MFILFLVHPFHTLSVAYKIAFFFFFISVKPFQPSLTVQNPDYSADAVYESGTNFSFYCGTDSLSTGYTFLRDSKNISYQISPQYQLTQSSPSDSGNYTCVVTTANGVSSDESLMVVISVIGKNIMYIFSLWFELSKQAAHEVSLAVV